MGTAGLTWQRLARSLVERYEHAVDHGGEIRVVLGVGREPVIRVGLRVLATEAYGEPAILIHADLGPVTRIDPWVGLDHNRRLAFGALAVDDQVLVLRAVLLTSTLSEDGFDLHVRRVAAEAAEIKRQLVAPAPTPGMFEHYC